MLIPESIAYLIVFLAVAAPFILFIFSLFIARKVSSTEKGKWIVTLLITGLFIFHFFFAPDLQKKSRNREWERKTAQFSKKFDEQCKKAGEIIYKTAENVDGVLFFLSKNHISFINGIAEIRSEFYKKGILSYRYVDHVDGNGMRYRYSGRQKFWKSNDKSYDGEFSLDKTPSPDMPRYSISYDREEAEFGIRFLLKIIDLETNEIMAEKTSYELHTPEKSYKCLSNPNWDFFLKVLKPRPLPSCNVRFVSKRSYDRPYYHSMEKGHHTFLRDGALQNTGTTPLEIRFYDGTLTDGKGEVAHEQHEAINNVRPRVFPPGQEMSFYIPNATLDTPTGSMRGTFTMMTEEGACEAEFPETALPLH